MQFQVPQFIETEDKVVGPLTLKQFGYVGGAAIIILLLFFVLDTFLWLVIAGFFGLVGAALAFGKYNGRPLIVLLIAVIDNIWQPKVYVFKPSPPKRAVKTKPSLIKIEKGETPEKPSFGGLKGLRNWIATSKTAIPKREKPLPRNFGKPQKEIKDRYEVVRRMTGERELAKRIDYR